MPIPVQTLVNRINFELDAEGSDRYTFDRDHIYAINAAQQWLVGLFNALFSEKKVTEEYLRELVYTKCWRTSNLSRFAFNPADVGHNLWSVISIFPDISYTGSVTAQPDAWVSVYQPNLIFSDSDQQAKRLTAEEWNERNRNVFMSGSKELNWADYTEYGYLNFNNYNPALTYPIELAISPNFNNGYLAMTYLKYPTDVTAIGDNVEFPLSLTDMLVNKALQFISIKQGDENATLFKLTSAELDKILKIIV